jgi:hypothetical protein
MPAGLKVFTPFPGGYFLTEIPTKYFLDQLARARESEKPLTISDLEWILLA